MAEHSSPPLASPVITTMLILQSDGRMTRPFAEYRAHFDKLVATGLPIVLYLDRSLPEETFPSTVSVIPISIEELTLWKETRGLDLQIPATRNPIKDTADYIIIVNSKTELVRRTIALGLPGNQHLFIDFGLFRLIRNTHRAQEQIRALVQHPSEEVVIPGCWSTQGDYLNPVNWRFCGGFFYGSTAALLEFAEANQQAVRD
ncbi:MAG: hypothetical protein ABL994_14170, partial [Verrucomicrobiales bacterium]